MLKALIITKVHPDFLAQLTTMGYSCDVILEIKKNQVIEIIHQYHGIITSNALSIDKEILDLGTQLKWVGRMGSGMEIIDTNYAAQKGIACFGSPDGNANAVAEQALGMLLALQHRVVKSHIELQNHIWLREDNRGYELENKTAAIIGLGHNGMAFAQKLIALNVNVLAFDTTKKSNIPPQIQHCDTLDEIYKKAEIISFHVPLKEDTVHYFNQSFLDKMHKPFTLMNLSRGGVVDLNVVLHGMQSGKIIAAALDVWQEEPITQTQNHQLKNTFNDLIHLPNFIGTAHIAGYTHEAIYKMSMSLLKQIKSLHS